MYSVPSPPLRVQESRNSKLWESLGSGGEGGSEAGSRLHGFLGFYLGSGPAFHACKLAAQAQARRAPYCVNIGVAPSTVISTGEAGSMSARKTWKRKKVRQRLDEKDGRITGRKDERTKGNGEKSPACLVHCGVCRVGQNRSEFVCK